MDLEKQGVRLLELLKITNHNQKIDLFNNNCSIIVLDVVCKKIIDILIVHYPLTMHKTFRENNRVYTQTVDEIRFFKDGVYMVYSCEYQQNTIANFLAKRGFWNTSRRQTA